MKNVYLLLAGESYLSLNCSYRDLAIGTQVGKPYWTYSKEWKHHLSVTDASVRPHNIYITSDEEIKEGDWVIFKGEDGRDRLMRIEEYCWTTDERKIYKMVGGGLTGQDMSKKIILTTDQGLIKDGVQEIPDEFLEWWIKNPSCDYIEIESQCLVEEKCACNSVKSVCKKPYYTFNYEVIIPKTTQEIIDEDFSGGLDLGQTTPKEKPKQETLEEACSRIRKELDYSELDYTSFKLDAKWQAEKMYSEEDLKYAFDSGRVRLTFDKERPFVFKNYDEWFEQFKKK